MLAPHRPTSTGKTRSAQPARPVPEAKPPRNHSSGSRSSSRKNARDSTRPASNHLIASLSRNHLGRRGIIVFTRGGPRGITAAIAMTGAHGKTPVTQAVAMTFARGMTAERGPGHTPGPPTSAIGKAGEATTLLARDNPLRSRQHVHDHLPASLILERPSPVTRRPGTTSASTARREDFFNRTSEMIP
jgi:hypothetical protein